MIEANPRASRTVPFVSKAIGVPLAKLACRLMLGERLADMDLRLPAPAAARVGQGGGAARSGASRGPTRCSGPEMKSTGEVMGVASDYPTAFGKAQAAAGAGLPAAGHGLHLGHRRRQAGRHPARRRLPRHGLPAWSPPAAPRTAIRRMGVPVERIKKISEGSPQRGGADRGRRGGPRDQHPDGLRRPRGRLRDPPRRRSARGIPCITTMSGASAAQRAIRAGRAGERRGDLAAGAARAAALRTAARRSTGQVKMPGGRRRRVTEPRTLAPPERRTATVSGVERLGAYDLITALDRYGPRDPRPGQFYMLAAAERLGRRRRRAALPAARVLLRARTRGGRRRGARLPARGGRPRHRSASPSSRPGDGLALVGPLGIGFRPPADGTRPLLVGGGIGAAPLLCWQEELGAAGEAPERPRDAPGPAGLPHRGACRRRRRSSPASRRWSPTTARSGGGRLSRNCCASELDARPECDGLRLRAAARCSRRSGAVRRARCARPARDGVGHGVRLRRLLRLRRADP